VDEIVTVKVLRPICDIYQLHTRHELVNDSKSMQVLTGRSKEFCPESLLINFMIFPFSIHGENIQNDGTEVTPSNGRTFTWQCHFHSTTSLARLYLPE